MQTRHFCFLFFCIITLLSTDLVASSGTISRSLWYAIDTPPRTQADLAREHAIRIRYTDRAIRCVETLPEMIREHLPKRSFIVSIYDPAQGGTRMTGLSVAESQLLDAIEVVVYGKATAVQGVLPGSFYYSPEWSAVFVPGVYMNNDWFCVAFTHELFHAQIHAEHAAWESEYDLIVEEIKAHELERAILEHQTQGAYGRALRQAIEGETRTDLAALFEKVEAVNATFSLAESDLELGIRYAQIYFDLTFLMLERTPHVSETMKVERYRSLRAFAAQAG